MRYATIVWLFTFFVAHSAHAEQFDTTYSDDGRYAEGWPSRDRSAVALLERPDGGLLQVSTIVGGCGSPTACPRLTYMTSTGVFLQSIGPATINLETVAAAALDSRGRIIVAGTSTPSVGGRNFRILRYLPDGTPDTSFAGDGNTEVDFYGLDDYATAVAVDADDNIVIIGQVGRSATDTDFGVTRLRSSDGALDTSFNGGKAVVPFDLGPGQQFDVPGAIAIAASGGRITVVGKAFDSTISRFRIAMTRLTSAGVLDTTFCNTSCSLQGSYTGIVNGRRVYYFGANTAHSDDALGVALLGNGGFLIVGETYATDGTAKRAAITRFTAAGDFGAEALNDGFGSNASYRSVQVSDANGQRVLVAGNSGPSSNYLLLQGFTYGLIPLAGYGNCLDNTAFCFIGGTGLGDNGPDQAGALNLDRSGRPLHAGTFIALSGDYRQSLFARFTNSSGPKPDRIFRNGFQ